MKSVIFLLAAFVSSPAAFAQTTDQSDPSSSNAAPAASEWSDWQTRRGHFQFQVRTEEAGAGVMKVRIRIRPDVERIAKEPYYRNETYFLEYWQEIDRQHTGGMGNTSQSQPRRLKFPPNAPASCVYEEEHIYAPNRASWIFMDHAVSYLPLRTTDGQTGNAFVDVVGFRGAHTGPGAVLRFSGVNQSSFQSVC